MQKFTKKIIFAMLSYFKDKNSIFNSIEKLTLLLIVLKYVIIKYVICNYFEVNGDYTEN